MLDKEESNGSQPQVQPQGVKFSLSKRKVLVRRPPLPTKKETTRGGREEDEEEEQEDVEYVTGFDEKLGLVGKDPERRRRGGVKVVPKLENSWRPEKRMKNIVMESDVTKVTEETFEMETMAFRRAVGPKPDVQYGLTVMTRVQEQTAPTRGVAAAAAAPPRRPSLFQEMEDQKLREDLSVLPEESSLERYEELPVEEFGEALLRGMGWEKGKPIGRNCRTAVAPVEYVRRQGREGLGAAPLPPKENNKKFVKPVEIRSNLQQAQQAVAFSREQINEVCRDSKARNAGPSHHGDDRHARLNEPPTCRVCHHNDVSTLLLPCRHVCLCKECAARLDACPLCHNLKQASVPVYLP